MSHARAPTNQTFRALSPLESLLALVLL